MIDDVDDGDASGDGEEEGIGGVGVVVEDPVVGGCGVGEEEGADGEGGVEVGGVVGEEIEGGKVGGGVDAGGDDAGGPVADLGPGAAGAGVDPGGGEAGGGEGGGEGASEQWRSAAFSHGELRRTAFGKLDVKQLRNWIRLRLPYYDGDVVGDKVNFAVFGGCGARGPAGRTSWGSGVGSGGGSGW